MVKSDKFTKEINKSIKIITMVVILGIMAFIAATIVFWNPSFVIEMLLIFITLLIGLYILYKINKRWRL